MKPQRAYAPQSLPSLIAGFEQNLILQALTASHWNCTKAAVLLGIKYKALLYRMKCLGIKR